MKDNADKELPPGNEEISTEVATRCLEVLQRLRCGLKLNSGGSPMILRHFLATSTDKVQG